jgi:hypothetical protein
MTFRAIQLRQIPSTRESARRLGLVTIGQMVAALVHAVEESARGLRVMEVPQIQQYPQADYQRAAAR